jgi:alkylation response protein AidB-like acyl-CoA dehydrogenase
VDLSLTEEQQMFRETARDFVDDMVVPYARDWDRAESMERGITKHRYQRLRGVRS